MRPVNQPNLPFSIPNIAQPSITPQPIPGTPPGSPLPRTQPVTPPGSPTLTKKQTCTNFYKYYRKPGDSARFNSVYKTSITNTNS